MNVGDTVYFLREYKILYGKVVKIGRKNIEIDIPPQWGLIAHTRKVAKEKVFEANEMVVPVWEQWKGKNGRGSHRIERTLYANKHRPGRNWLGAGGWDYAWESAYGVLSK